MAKPATTVTQQSVEPTRGTQGSKNVVIPIVRDIRKLFSERDRLDTEDDRLDKEIKKLQNPPPGAGAGGGDGTLMISVNRNGTFLVYSVPGRKIFG